MVSPALEGIAVLADDVDPLAGSFELYAFEPYGLIVRFAADTGLRANELAALRIRDVNLLHRRVEIPRTLHRVKGGWEISHDREERR